MFPVVTNIFQYVQYYVVREQQEQKYKIFFLKIFLKNYFIYKKLVNKSIKERQSPLHKGALYISGGSAHNMRARAREREFKNSLKV